MSARSTWTPVAFLVAGAIVGFVAGRTSGGFADGSAPPRAADAARATGYLDAPVTLSPRLAEAESALAAERVAHAEAVTARVHLEQELAAVRSETAAIVHAPARPAPDSRVVDARIRAMTIEADAALEKKDAKAAMALFAESATCGRAAWPIALKIGAALSLALDGDDTLGVNELDLFKLLTKTPLADLYEETLLHPKDDQAPFRRLAAWGITMLDSGAGSAVVARGLAVETDETNLQMFTRILTQTKDSAAVAPIVDGLATTQDPATRARLIGVLTQLPGDEATRALTSLVATETDASLKSGIDSSLKLRNAPVDGFFLTSVTNGSVEDTAGLRENDIITLWNGAPPSSRRAPSNVADDAIVAVTVYRDGALITLSLKGNFSSLGAQGTFTKPAGR